MIASKTMMYAMEILAQTWRMREGKRERVRESE